MHAIRILSHGRGNPDTEVGRTLNAMAGRRTDRKEGMPRTIRESDQSIVL